jgi:hypothetical protein
MVKTSIQSKLTINGRPRAQKDLSIKERLYLKDLFSVSEGDPANAYARNFPARNKTDAIAKSKRLMSSPRVRKEVLVMMERAGLSMDQLMITIKDGLNAKMPITFKGRVKSEYVNHDVRHKYLNTLLELMDAYPAKKTEIDVRDVSPERKSQLIGILNQVLVSEAVIKKAITTTRVV